jgi:tetratricopeptide (TPR) repeat protein/tRNA A-37 threonylcarbamoyl transferase component Bud32
MAAESLVERLLDEISDSGRTPEEVCGACPGLLPEVRRRWRQICAVEAELDALFPASGNSPDADTSLSWHARAELPRIPGYDLEALLGRGGMGVVYKARHRRLNRVVAIKMLIAGAYAGPPERERFQREAEAVASLHHANIVAVYDVGDHDGWPYFTMELLEGGNLTQALAGSPRPAREAASLLIALAEAVQVAHRAGIVHRDVKPANILLAADGTPKVADFGLARHFEGESGLTLSGARIGTPSYMAPEQVNGKAGAIGPATDIYALGALLYEMLTGRPPFRGETAAETERQVLHDEPVAPSRLNTKVPRDPETICLKCLSKEPQRRYASAAALADDLRRYTEGRPIQARPVGWGERSLRWGRRNPLAAALLVTALALVGLASGGGVWLVQQRAELRNEVVTTVAQAVSLRQGFHFHEARELLEQVRKRVERGGPDDLRRQVDGARTDVILAQGLDDARTHGAKVVDGLFDQAAAEPLYLSAFADAGLVREGKDIEAVAAAVRASAVREEIVAALDDWASITPDLRRREWLLAVARSADPDGVRDRLRQPELWLDTGRLTRVANELGVAELSPQLATALGRVARASGGEAVALLTAAQRRFPQDFWVNFELAWTLNQENRREEGLGYFRAALALRPNSSATYSGLGEILFNMDRLDEAIDRLEQALRLDPANASAHNNLAHALNSKGRLDGAIDHFRQALSIIPNSAVLHTNLGMALRGRGRLDEAIEHLQRGVGIDPNYARGHHCLGVALLEKGRVDEAFGHLQQSLSLDPRSGSARSYFIALLRDRGRFAEAICQLEQGVRLEAPKSTVARNQLVRYRHEAACANVRAAAGQGSEDARRGEPERAGKRRQALDWLRANLELTARLRNDGNVLGWSLATWRSDPALASVRDPAELAKLPDAERELWRRFWMDVAASIAADPIEQGWEHAARRQWDRAVDDYKRSLMRSPMESGHFWFEYAAVSLLSGDRAAYTTICTRMLEQCGKAGGPRPYHLARTCTLAPDAVADASLPGRLAEKELKGSAREFWSLTEQGALAYRAGRFQEAVPFFEQSLRADSRPGHAVLNWLWLALAKQRLGEAEEARRWLNKAQAWLDQYRDGMPARAEGELGLHLHDWLEAHVLRLEAEGVVQPGPPRNAAENRELAVPRN